MVQRFFAQQYGFEARRKILDSPEGWSRGNWTLKGRKSVVLHAPAADLFFVSARTSGSADATAGISLFAVPRDAPGVALSEYRTIDGMCAADVELADALGTLIGVEGKAFA